MGGLRQGPIKLIKCNFGKLKWPMVTKNPLKEKSSEKKFNLFELKLEFANFFDLISKPGLLEPDN